jgi:hypothetical protein
MQDPSTLQLLLLLLLWWQRGSRRLAWLLLAASRVVGAVAGPGRTLRQQLFS